MRIEEIFKPKGKLEMNISKLKIVWKFITVGTCPPVRVLPVLSRAGGLQYDKTTEKEEAK